MKRIPLTQGKFAIVDDEDFKWLSRYKWYAKKDYNTFYAVRNTGKSPNQRQIYMHKQIMGVLPGIQIDHINHNGLNNRKCFLRICSNAQNQRNQQVLPNRGKSIYKGVSWCKRSKKWVAQIIYNHKHKFLGYRNSEIECAELYDKKAKELFGEFASLNYGK